MLKKTGYVLAGCIIFIAIIVSASRLLAPILEEHRTDIEIWASTMLKLPVTIRKVHVSWYKYQPQISLDDVTILNAQSKEPILQMSQVSVSFSIPQSILQKKLIPSGVIISGTDINIYQKPNGEIAVQGFPSLGGFNNQPFKSETKFADVIGWLSQMPRLILNNIDLRYSNLNGIKRFLTLYNLRFENTDNTHVILGKALLHQEQPTEATVNVQWEGDVADLNNINANIYVFVSGLSLPQWWTGLSWQGWHLTSGNANAKIWAKWNKGTFQKIQSTFEVYGVDLFSDTDKSSRKISRLSGNVGWKRDGKNQIVAGDDIFIDLPSHLWPSTSFYLSMTPDAAGKLLPTAVNTGYVDLADLQSFLFSSPAVLSDSIRNLLIQLKLKGDIQSLSVIFPSGIFDVNHVSLTGNFSRLSVMPWQHFPGIQNLSGVVNWNGSQGDLSLHGTQTSFQYDSVFTNPLMIDQLSGNVLWEKDKNSNWLIHLKAVQVLNSDTAINANGSLTIPVSGAVLSDLNVNFTLQRANHVTRYLPMRIFDPDLVKWLNQAFVSGAVESGNIRLRGPLNDFPFDKGNGQFYISGITKNIDFHFAPNWPELKNLNGKIVFSGRQIMIDVDHADIEGIPVQKVHGVIPYLGDVKPSVLDVQTGDIPTDFAKGLDFVHASPLEKTIGKMFTDTTLTGPLILKLALTVPLKNPDETTVKGDITFKDALLNLIPWNLVINHLRGQLHFTEKSTNASGIQGEVFNKPLVLNLQTIQKTKSISVVQATITNNIDITDIENWLKIPFSQIVKGSTNITANIDFSENAPIDVHIQSNLKGLTIDLPEQYSKKQEESRNFTADITIQEKQPLRVKMNYGNLLGAAFILERKNDKFNLTAADLRLGAGTAAWPSASGLYITGNLSKLDWDKVKTYMVQSETSHFSGMTFKGVDVTINKVSLPGQQLTNTRFQITPSDIYWDIELNGPEVKGKVQVPMKMIPQSTITAQFQELNLISVSNTDNLGEFDLKSLPSITFTANDVSYNKMELGQVAFKTLSTANGVTIQSLTVKSPRIQLHATGDWTQAGTTLQGKATSSNVSNLLNSLGFDAHNFVSSKGSFNFNLSWRTPPYALTLASMNGQASLDLGEGRIVEVGQTSGAKMDLGRMLSIFSLQTIPRRLNFDFSDVFQKGYSFDSLRGDFKFTNGDAYTNNTHFEGPVAKVDIYGRIGLAKKDYDFTLSVTPYVTSSIPVAATLITGQPVIGIAAWAVDKVISSGVTKATTYYYAVSGTWSNPIWKSVTTPKSNQ